MAATAPLVSVIIPTRNRVKLLSRSVASVLGQSYQNLELIVVNDASTDDSREVLAAMTDPRLRIINHATNKGAAAARNVGISMARGEFIAFQDDDDVWLVHKLERQVAALRTKSQQPDWCICGNIRVTKTGCKYIGGEFYRSQIDFSQGIGQRGSDWGLIATPGWLVRSELLKRTGSFDERIRSWDDWELGIRLAREGRLIFVDEPLWIQDWVSGGGLTKAQHIRANDLQIIMEKHGDMWKDRPKVLARHYYYMGRVLNFHDGSPAGRDFLFRSLSFSPFQFKTWTAIMLSYLRRDWMRAATLFARRVKTSFK